MLVIRLIALMRTPSPSRPRSSDPFLGGSSDSTTATAWGCSVSKTPASVCRSVDRMGQERVALLQEVLDLLLDPLGLVFPDGIAEHVPQEVLEVESRLLLERLAELACHVGRLPRIAETGGVEVAQLHGQFLDGGGVEALEHLRRGGRVEAGQKQCGFLPACQGHVRSTPFPESN